MIILLYLGGETSAGALCLVSGISLRCRKFGESPEENSKDSSFRTGLQGKWLCFVWEMMLWGRATSVVSSPYKVCYETGLWGKRNLPNWWVTFYCQRMLMKKGSRKASDSLESYSYRAFKEQVRQIFIADEIKIRLILPHAGVNILPAPHLWVEKGLFFLLMSENSISALGREPCKSKQRSQKDLVCLDTMWSQEGTVTLWRDGWRLDSEETEAPLCSSEPSSG